jgi:hypothetical protein
MPLWLSDKTALVKTQFRFGSLLMLLWFTHNAALMP